MKQGCGSFDAVVPAGVRQVQYVPTISRTNKPKQAIARVVILIARYGAVFSALVYIQAIACLLSFLERREAKLRLERRGTLSLATPP